MKTWKRILIIIGFALLAAVLILLITLPGIIRNYIEKNDQDLIGREISIKDIDINYFSASVEITGFDMKEANGDTSFISFNRMFTDLHLWSLFRKHIVIKKYHLDGAKIRVVQDGIHFNFDDLLALSENTETASTEEKDSDPWHITVLDVDLRRNSLSYESNLHPQLSFDSIRVQVPHASDTSQYIKSSISLDVSTGGSLELLNLVDLLNSYYTVDMIATDLDLHIIKSYVEPFMKIGDLEGRFSSNFLIGGSWVNTDVFNLGGEMAIDNFALSDERSTEVLVLEHGEIDIDSIRLNDGYYRINRILIDGFSGLFERYIDGDNFSNMLVDFDNTNQDSTATDTLSTDPGVDYSNPFSLMSYYL